MRHRVVVVVAVRVVASLLFLGWVGGVHLRPGSSTRVHEVNTVQSFGATSSCGRFLLQKGDVS